MYSALELRSGYVSHGDSAELRCLGLSGTPTAGESYTTFTNFPFLDFSRLTTMESLALTQEALQQQQERNKWYKSDVLSWEESLAEAKRELVNEEGILGMLEGANGGCLAGPRSEQITMQISRIRQAEDKISRHKEYLAEAQQNLAVSERTLGELKAYENKYLPLPKARAAVRPS